MAKLAGIGTTPRETVNINPGNGGQPTGNGQQTQNTQGNIPPVADGQPYETQNNGNGQNGGVQTGPVKPVGPGNTKTEVNPVIDAGPKPEHGVQVGPGPRNGQGPGPGPRGPQEYKIRGPRNGELSNPRWSTILTLPLPDENSVFEHDRDYENRRSDEARDRQNQESHATNQANSRRALIREYLRQNLHDTILETHTHRGTKSQIDLPRLTQTVADRLSRTYNDPTILNGRNLNVITQEISHLLVREFNPGTGNPTSVPYDRAVQIASLLRAHIGEEAPKGFLQMTDQEMLEGLIFLQLCCAPGSNIKEMREITSHKPSILPDAIPWSMFRATGLLAANLMKEGVPPRTTAYLDAAVQRFFKMLVVNNELGVLLAAVRLSADARAGRVPIGSIASLVRIYELIAQLMIVTERAMKEAAEVAARKPPELKRTDKNLAFAAALEPGESESALRQYLAFNPSAQADSGAFAFFDDQIAETSARIAVDSSQREMVEWLGSGRHRFVTEVDLGKPIGIVIDRASDECFTASQIRVVLVRDGSVLGWHILRSCLVG
ncbi:MAG: hypothetical protein HOP17_11905 [Acidobacteria bacterium]|nr:hypothetical protein [Acidobacteriota bacterium]